MLKQERKSYYLFTILSLEKTVNILGYTCTITEGKQVHVRIPPYSGYFIMMFLNMFDLEITYTNNLLSCIWRILLVTFWYQMSRRYHLKHVIGKYWNLWMQTKPRDAFRLILSADIVKTNKQTKNVFDIDR